MCKTLFYIFIWNKLTFLLDLSVEQVASLASQNALPIPTLDLDAIQTSTSSMSPAIFRSTSGVPVAPSPIRAPTQPPFSSDDPWTTPRFQGDGAVPSLINGAPSSISGTGLPKDWWKRQERIQIRMTGLQGFILNRYMVYEISSDVSFIVAL